MFLNLENKNAKLEISFSHLAMADILSSDGITCSQEQIAMFNRVTQRLKEKFPNISSSLGQSAHILTTKEAIADISRLGISMYGANPFYGTAWEEHGQGLMPVMSVSAPILTIRDVEDGCGAGYGLEPKMKGKRKIAVVGIGYSDGYRRSLVSKAHEITPIHGLFNGKRVQRVGNVCMQVSFFDITGCEAKVGDRLYVLGGTGKNTISSDELAAWWDTIAYEPLCQMGRTDNNEIID